MDNIPDELLPLIINVYDTEIIALISKRYYDLVKKFTRQYYLQMIKCVNKYISNDISEAYKKLFSFEIPKLQLYGCEFATVMSYILSKLNDEQLDDCPHITKIKEIKFFQTKPYHIDIYNDVLKTITDIRCEKNICQNTYSLFHRHMNMVSYCSPTIEIYIINKKDHYVTLMYSKDEFSRGNSINNSFAEFFYWLTKYIIHPIMIGYDWIDEQLINREIRYKELSLKMSPNE